MLSTKHTKAKSFKKQCFLSPFLLRGRSQTTFTKFGFFWPPTPLRLHFLWYWWIRINTTWPHWGYTTLKTPFTTRYIPPWRHEEFSRDHTAQAQTTPVLSHVNYLINTISHLDCPDGLLVARTRTNLERTIDIRGRHDAIISTLIFSRECRPVCYSSNVVHW